MSMWIKDSYSPVTSAYGLRFLRRIYSQCLLHLLRSYSSAYYMRGVQASTSACYMGRLGCDICITISEQSYDININMLAITSIWISFWKKRIEEFVRSPRPSMKDAWHEKQTCRRSISLAREMQGEELWIKGGVGSPPPLIRFFPCENTLLKANCTLLLESSNLYIDIEISVVFGRDCLYKNVSSF